MQQIPVYIFTGFLESGKTTFVQGTMEDPRFNSGEKTLVLICEEGEVELDTAKFPSENAFVRVVDDPEDLTEAHLAAWAAECGCERVLVEYNGMWLIQPLYDAMPDGWVPYQDMFFIDGRTFLNYNANMRSLVVDKIKDADVCVFNRVPKNTDVMEFHKIVRGVSRRTDIVYEFEDGTVVPDEIEDPLPFDLEAPVVRIEDRDFALFYRDMTEEPKKYKGKTVEFKALAAVDRKFPDHVCALGRHIMTCCVEDIQYCALAAKYNDPLVFENGVWYTVRAQIDIRFSRLYGKKGPIYVVQSAQKTNEPEEKVATFY